MSRMLEEIRQKKTQSPPGRAGADPVRRIESHVEKLSGLVERHAEQGSWWRAAHQRQRALSALLLEIRMEFGVAGAPSIPRLRGYGGLQRRLWWRFEWANRTDPTGAGAGAQNRVRTLRCAITKRKRQRLTKNADRLLGAPAGEECGPPTQAYSGQYARMYLLGIRPGEGSQHRGLQRIADNVNDTLALRREIRRAERALRFMRTCRRGAARHELANGGGFRKGAEIHGDLLSIGGAVLVGRFSHGRSPWWKQKLPLFAFAPPGRTLAFDGEPHEKLKGGRPNRRNNGIGNSEGDASATRISPPAPRQSKYGRDSLRVTHTYFAACRPPTGFDPTSAHME